MPGIDTRRIAAVIGAGPSGFYVTEQLLAAGLAVDLFDRLPTPFGLVRAGVAPDHPKIKSVTRVFEKIAAHEHFRFFGGVEVGSDVIHAELRDRYHATVYALGAAADRHLGVPGEELPGSVAAAEFVGWYNGHPDYADHTFDLSCSRAVVVGNGNVALDVARMLVLGAEELSGTDTADHAVRDLGRAAVREVIVLGRRGPAQASFTTVELRELGDMRHADVAVDTGGLDLDAEEASDPLVQRNLAVLRGFAGRQPADRRARIELRFLRTPLEILGDERGLYGLRVAHNRLDGGRPVPTGAEEVIDCGLVVRAIGYRGLPLAGVPFDDTLGLIPNEHGRVVSQPDEPRMGEYVVGWIKRGPSGVIGTNKKDAIETAKRVIEDAEAGVLDRPGVDGDPAATMRWLRARVPALVDWAGWTEIDRHELAAGARSGRPRVKLVRREAMLALSRGAGAT
jgi:ferredoxin--NADP+ reductase